MIPLPPFRGWVEETWADQLAIPQHPPRERHLLPVCVGCVWKVCSLCAPGSDSDVFYFPGTETGVVKTFAQSGFVKKSPPLFLTEPLLTILFMTPRLSVNGRPGTWLPQVSRRRPEFGYSTHALGGQ